MPEPALTACDHLDAIEDPPALSDTCLSCRQEGTRPVAVRVCRTCGHVGCCDSTPGRHARAHFHETGHPLIRPYDPARTWTWCYVDDAYVDAD